MADAGIVAGTRRESAGETSGSRAFGRRFRGPDAGDPLHGVEDVRVGAAAAEIPGDRRADLDRGWASDCESRSTLQDMIIPDVQKPHWRASAAMKACWTGDSRPSAARPSIVVISLARDLVGQNQAGADRLSVDEHGAGAAGAPAADDLRARHARADPAAR